MAAKSNPGWGFLIAGTVFLIIAIVPLTRGDRLHTAYFVVGIVFLVLAAAVLRRGRSRRKPPAA